MHDSDADVAVVGAGVLGLSTAYALLERGVSVRVYEPGVPGQAQSGGESRLFRHAHDDPRLVRRTVESRALYDAWSERLGVPLVSGDGALAIGAAAEERLAVLEREGVAARPLGATELAGHLPLLAAYDGPAVLDERGGSIRTGAMVRGAGRRARRPARAGRGAGRAARRRRRDGRARRRGAQRRRDASLPPRGRLRGPGHRGLRPLAGPRDPGDARRAGTSHLPGARRPAAGAVDAAGLQRRVRRRPGLRRGGRTATRRTPWASAR